MQKHAGSGTFERNKMGEHQILILKTNPSKAESCTKPKENDMEIIGKVEGSIWWISELNSWLQMVKMKRDIFITKIIHGSEESIGAVVVIQVNLSA